ncbi:hypothetical protein [Vacuolonema iberomarrocanum]|uniref:hypothetical protein n=1 Tax=Vacuolonema iberomarrocanum TaxID=3454632 RepID=UPI001A0C0F7F|nr:hypothetical protein [filamentous cyanobacterium LEGE 07170]
MLWQTVASSIGSNSWNKYQKQGAIAPCFVSSEPTDTKFGLEKPFIFFVKGLRKPFTIGLTQFDDFWGAERPKNHRVPWVFIENAKSYTKNITGVYDSNPG